MYVQSDASLWVAAIALVVPLFWGMVIPAIGSLLGNLAGGRAKGKEAAANANQQQDVLRTSQYGTQQNAVIQALLAAEAGRMNRAQLDLLRRTFALNAPTTRAQQAVRGDVMSRAQDVRVPDHPRANVVRIEGGMRPSMLSGNTRALGAEMSRKALVDQLAGDKFQDVPEQNWGGAVLQPPGVTPLPKASGFDKFLNIAAPIAGAVGGGMQAYTNQQNMDWLKQLLIGQTTAGQIARPQPQPFPPQWPNLPTYPQPTM